MIAIIYQRLKLGLFITGLGLFVTFAVFAVMSATANAATATTTHRECDDNAVLKCGALTSREVALKYMDAEDSSGRIIFNDMGITNEEMTRFESRAVMGRVLKDGRVYVGDRLVANSAQTAGRQYMPGSATTVSRGVTYYIRPPSVSFRSNEIEAFVVLQDNKFKYAILTSCGNPVKAVPIAPPPVAKTQTPKPKPTPPPNNVIVIPPVQQQQQQQTVVIESSPPPAPAPVVVQEKTIPAALPETGIGNVVSVFGLTAVAGAIGHAIYGRLRRLMPY